MLSILRKLNGYSFIVSGLLALSIQQSVAADNLAKNLAIAGLIQAEEARQRIGANGLDTLPNTYVIIQKLNRIKTDGPEATPEQQKIIARSVVNSALYINNSLSRLSGFRPFTTFPSLVAQYLAEDNDRTLPTRMAYLAISVTALYLDEALERASFNGKTLVTHDVASEVNPTAQVFKEFQWSIPEQKRAFFSRQLERFYGLAKEVYDEKRARDMAESDRRRAEGVVLVKDISAALISDYPKFYQDILRKVNPNFAQEQKQYEALRNIQRRLEKLGSLKRQSEDVFSVDDTTKSLTQTPIEQYLLSINLTSNDVDQLMPVLALANHAFPRLWRLAKRLVWGYTSEEKQAVVEAYKKLSLILNNTNLQFLQQLGAVDSVFEVLEQQHTLDENDIRSIAENDSVIKGQRLSFQDRLEAKRQAYSKEMTSAVKRKLLAFKNIINNTPEIGETWLYEQIRKIQQELGIDTDVMKFIFEKNEELQALSKEIDTILDQRESMNLSG